MSPLVALTLTAFGGLVVLALLLWSLIAPRRRTPEPSPAAPRSRPAPTVSNDEVRGARARSASRPRSAERPKSDDAFEQFLRAERDER